MGQAISGYQSLELTSKITTTVYYDNWDTTKKYPNYNHSSKEVSGSLSFSVSDIPAGSSIDSSYFECSFSGATTYGGTTIINGYTTIDGNSTYTSGNLGAITSVTIGFFF